MVVPYIKLQTKEVFLGFSGVVKPDGGKLNSDGTMTKQTQTFNFGMFLMFKNFKGKKFCLAGIFGVLIVSPGNFLGFVGSPRDFLES